MPSQTVPPNLPLIPLEPTFTGMNADALGSKSDDDERETTAPLESLPLHDFPHHSRRELDVACQDVRTLFSTILCAFVSVQFNFYRTCLVFSIRDSHHRSSIFHP